VLHEIVRVEKLAAESGTKLDSLLKWLKDNEVRDIASTGKAIEFRSAKNGIEGAKGARMSAYEGIGLGLGFGLPRDERVEYYYKIPLAKIKTKPFAVLLSRPFSRLRLCGHVSEMSGEKHLAYLTTTARESMFERNQRVEDLWGRGETDQRYDLLCGECFRRIDSIGCEESIKKEGFTFTHRCPTQKIIFESLLEKHGIKFQSGESDRFHQRGEFMDFLPDLGVFASDSVHGLSETVEALRPDSLLAFSKKQTLPKFLQFGTNVILFDPEAEKEPMLIYDRTTPVENSVEVIINGVLEKLDNYSSQIRGKEHDKLIAAFERIGKEFGFIPQTEMAQKGSRVDVVWLGDKGTVEVAIEVETSAQWKKDIVTTWESSPRLAVVLAHFKTDKAVEDIVQYSLLQQMPHKLLFIGYIQKKAYLIEKGSIVKSYTLKSAT
jgi:hypothetical protein